MNSFDIREAGALCNGITDDRLALHTLVNDTMQRDGSPSAGGPLDIYGVVRIGSDVTIPANVSLRFIDGAYLSVDSGKTVTILGPVDSMLRKKFGGAGTVSFAGNTNLTEVCPQWWGATSGGVLDETAQLNAAAIGSGNKLLHAPAGSVFKTSDTITLTGPTDMMGAEINYSGSGVAVQVGDGINILADTCVKLPRVNQAAKTGTGWGTFGTVDISASVGVKIVGFFEGEIHVPWVGNFAVGLLEHGLSIGSSYTKIFLGHLYNNKVNHRLDGEADGWVNENIHIGGRMSHDSAELIAPNTVVTGEPGVRNVLISPLASVINNHRWIGTSLEGDVPEFMVDCAGSNNLFLFCRYEAGQLNLGAHPKIQITGADALDNEFHGGLSLDSVTWTFTGGAVAGETQVQHSGGMRWVPGDAGTKGLLVIGNGSDSTMPTITVLEAGLDPHSFDEAWSAQIGARTFKGKATGDAAASPRVTIDFQTGDITSVGTVEDKNTTRGTTPTTTATFATILTPAAAGRYTVTWGLSPFGSGNQFCGIANLIYDGAGSAYIMSSTNGASSACQMSGADFQIKQSSGSPQNMNWVCVYTSF